MRFFEFIKKLAIEDLLKVVLLVICSSIIYGILFGSICAVVNHIEHMIDDVSSRAKCYKLELRLNDLEQNINVLQSQIQDLKYE